MPKVSPPSAAPRSSAPSSTCSPRTIPRRRRHAARRRIRLASGSGDGEFSPAESDGNRPARGRGDRRPARALAPRSAPPARQRRRPLVSPRHRRPPPRGLLAPRRHLGQRSGIPNSAARSGLRRGADRSRYVDRPHRSPLKNIARYRRPRAAGTARRMRWPTISFDARALDSAPACEADRRAAAGGCDASVSASASTSPPANILCSAVLAGFEPASIGALAPPRRVSNSAITRSGHAARRPPVSSRPPSIPPTSALGSFASPRPDDVSSTAPNAILMAGSQKRQCVSASRRPAARSARRTGRRPRQRGRSMHAGS